MRPLRARNGTRWHALVTALAFGWLGIVPLAEALPGYANLINAYCRDQGTVQMRYTDNGCTLCHHQGTFVSDPEHRVEPQWSEFELGRSSGDYRFFCPADGWAPPLLADTPDSVADAAPESATDAGSHASMAWMALGFPSGHETTIVADPDSRGGLTRYRTAASVGVTKAASAEALAPPGPGADVLTDRRAQLTELRAVLGVRRTQESAWTELVEAVLAVAPLPETTPKVGSAAALDAQLQTQQRQLAQRTAQLRAVRTALVRLNAQLDERQQRLLAARLPSLLGEPVS